MHEYDVALKILLQASAASIIRQITGGLSVAHWLSAEMPQVQTSRADLLGSTLDGTLLHFELQSTNDPEMALRMMEYALRIYRAFRKFPRQTVLYVGEAPMRMSASWAEADFSFQYTLIDIRDLDSAALLASPHIEDNLLAILTRLPDQMGMVRIILKKIAELDEPARIAAFAQFLIISGLRRLSSTVKEEAQKLPILNDILDHEVIGPAILQGRREGRQEGRQEGRREMLRHQLEKRFGPIPETVNSRLLRLSAPELDAVGLRLFDVTKLDDLF